jgi:hypothetical protein
MMNKCRLLALLAGIALLSAAHAENVRLGMLDVYFHYKPAVQGSALCGYSVLGNHNSRDNPRVEWDINIDELVEGDNRIVGVSAGTFTVKDKTRTARAPIIGLSFSTGDDRDPFEVRLVGTPNSDNGVRGVLDFDRGVKLLTTIMYDDQPIIATLKYRDGTSDMLQFAGYKDSRKFGKNSKLEDCLRGVTPHRSKLGTRL